MLFKCVADCNNLTSIPEGLLPVTTLAYNCYEYMFANCNIEYTPILPAENLADDCYKYMFRFCDKLSSVSFGGKLQVGLEGFSKKGNFYYSYKWLNIVRGDYAVPLDWDIIAPD